MTLRYYAPFSPHCIYTGSSIKQLITSKIECCTSLVIRAATKWLNLPTTLLCCPHRHYYKTKESK